MYMCMLTGFYRLLRLPYYYTILHDILPFLDVFQGHLVTEGNRIFGFKRYHFACLKAGSRYLLSGFDIHYCDAHTVVFVVYKKLWFHCFAFAGLFEFIFTALMETIEPQT